MKKRFACYFWFVGWDCWSLGLHVCPSKPNVEIHLPFGFIRIGWVECYEGLGCINAGAHQWRSFGYSPRNH